jgi:hypothetical protein
MGVGMSDSRPGRITPWRRPWGKAIPVTGRGGLWCCEVLRISLCMHNRLTDGVGMSDSRPGRITPWPRPWGKAIPVTGRGGLWCCEVLRISLCMHNRLTDGGRDVSLTRRPPRYCPEPLLSSFWY